MTTKNKNQRVGVFIDVSNMYYSAKNLYNANVNFGKVLELAVANRQLIRAIAYTIRAEVNKEQAFFDALSKEGFEVKSKDLQIFPGGVKKGDWDVGIAVDAIKLADRLDAIILVTGDGDYVPLVYYLQENKGCLVEAIAFGKSASAKLKEAVDDFFDMDSDPAPYLLNVDKKNRYQNRRSHNQNPTPNPVSSQSPSQNPETNVSPVSNPTPKPEKAPDNQKS